MIFLIERLKRLIGKINVFVISTFIIIKNWFPLENKILTLAFLGGLIISYDKYIVDICMGGKK